MNTLTTVSKTWWNRLCKADRVLQLTCYGAVTIMNVHYDYIVQSPSMQMGGIQRSEIILCYYYLCKLHLKSFWGLYDGSFYSHSHAVCAAQSVFLSLLTISEPMKMLFKYIPDKQLSGFSFLLSTNHPLSSLKTS